MSVVSVRYAEMKSELQSSAAEIAKQAMKLHRREKDIAAYIKREFDNKYKPIWHCIAGRNFGSYVTHEADNIIYFYIDDMAFLLFKTR